MTVSSVHVHYCYINEITDLKSLRFKSVSCKYCLLDSVYLFLKDLTLCFQRWVLLPDYSPLDVVYSYRSKLKIFLYKSKPCKTSETNYLRRLFWVKIFLELYIYFGTIVKKFISLYITFLINRFHIDNTDD